MVGGPVIIMVGVESTKNKSEAQLPSSLHSSESCHPHVHPMQQGGREVFKDF
jgi:hypothetical protein